jgi:hypothetical protein
VFTRPPPLHHLLSQLNPIENPLSINLRSIYSYPNAYEKAGGLNFYIHLDSVSSYRPKSTAKFLLFPKPISPSVCERFTKALLY